MLLSAGERVAGRFLVGRLIAEGGLSEVYEVHHIELGSVYALKLLRADHPSITKRLLMEGRIQAQLTHPNIAPVLDVVRHQGRVGLLMPMILGKSMAELLARRTVIPVAESLELISGVLCGVGAAHGAGVLHRDIKPGNVLLMVEGDRMRPLVTDFGIAKVAEVGANFTKVGSAMGTPGFSAPEQVLDAADVDARADIFSLGVVLYRMLTGRMPYVSPDGSVRIGSVVSEVLTPLGDADATLPPDLCAAVDKALAKSADDRFADLPEMARALFQKRPKLLARVLAPSGIGPINVALPTLEPEDEEEERMAALVGGGLISDGVDALVEAAQANPSRPTLAPVPGNDSLPAPVTGPTKTQASAVPDQSDSPLGREGKKGTPWVWMGLAGSLLLVGGSLWWGSQQEPAVMSEPSGPAAVGDAPDGLEPIASLPQAAPLTPDVGLESGTQEPQAVAEPAAGESGELAVDQPDEEKSVQAVVKKAPVEPVRSGEPAIVEPVTLEEPAPTEPAGEPDELDGVAAVDPLEEAGSSPADPEPEIIEAQEPLEPPSWAGPNVEGAWSGTAGGRPATMRLKMTQEGQVTGELVFILGATRRSFPVRGSVDGQGRLTLSSGSDLSLSAQASDMAINGTYTQGRASDQGIRLTR